MSESSDKKTDFDAARELDAPLRDQLARFSAALRDNNPAVAEAYQRLVDLLKRGKAGAGAPKAGDPLPPFTLADEDGHLVSSARLLARGPLVISFNRGHWCPFCWLELGALHDRYEQIRKLGAEMISITPDTAAYSKRLKARLGLRFPVLTDLDNAYAMELGLVMALSDEVKTRLQEAGLQLNVYQKNDAWFIPLPATFLVDREGRIAYAFVDADFRKRADPERLLEAVAALAGRG